MSFLHPMNVQVLKSHLTAHELKHTQVSKLKIPSPTLCWKPKRPGHSLSMPQCICRNSDELKKEVIDGTS
jgi:hypothetical protein